MYSPLCFVDSIPIPFSTCVRHHRVSSAHACLCVSIFLLSDSTAFDLGCMMILASLVWWSTWVYTEPWSYPLSPVKDAIGSLIFFNKCDALWPSCVYHFDTQELLILPSLSMDRWSFRQPLRFFPLAYGSSPWILKPVLPTMMCSGFWGDNRQLIFGLMVFPLLDKIVWSRTLILSFINWNIEVTKPSVCRRGRWKMSSRERIVSMALSEKC